MASGVEFRHARQAARQSETANSLIFGGVALGVVICAGLGVGMWKIQAGRNAEYQAAAEKVDAAKQTAAAARAAMTPFEKCIMNAQRLARLHGQAMVPVVAGGLTSAEHIRMIEEIKLMEYEQTCERKEKERQ